MFVRARSRPFHEKLIEQTTVAYLSGLLALGIFALVRLATDRNMPWYAATAMHAAAAPVYSMPHTTLLWLSRPVIYAIAGLGTYDYGIMSLRYLMDLPNDLTLAVMHVRVARIVDLSPACPSTASATRTLRAHRGRYDSLKLGPKADCRSCEWCPRSPGKQSLMQRQVLRWIALLLIAGCDSAVVGTGDASVSLRITSVGGASPVAVDQLVARLVGPTPRTVTGPPGTTQTIDGLSPGTYTVALEGLTAGEVERYGETSNVQVRAGSNTVSITYGSFVPQLEDVPGSLIIGQNVVIQFGRLDGATGYRIEWSTSPGFTNIDFIETSSTSVTVPIASPGTYYFRVKAKNRFDSLSRPSSTQGPVVVAGEPRIVVASPSLSFSASAAGPSPASQSVSVTNGGDGTLSGLQHSTSYQSGQPSGWLTAGLSGTTAPTTLTLSPATGSLLPGTYTATVSVSSAVASNSPQTVAVSFTVAPPAPQIVLSPASRSFNATAGGADPSSQNVSVSNGGGGSLTGLQRSISYQSGQPTGWLTANLSGTSVPATLTVSPSTGTLPAGTYTATVAVSSPVAPNSPQSVTVTFTVMPGSMQITATPDNVHLIVYPEGPFSQVDFPVAVTGSGNLSLSQGPVQHECPGALREELLSFTIGAVAPTTLLLTVRPWYMDFCEITTSVIIHSDDSAVADKAVNLTLTGLLGNSDANVFNLSATNITQTSAVLNAQTDGTAYSVSVDYTTDPTFNTVLGGGLLAQTVSGPRTWSYPVTGLTPGTDYYYRFAALNHGDGRTGLAVHSFRTAN